MCSGTHSKIIAGKHNYAASRAKRWIAFHMVSGFIVFT